LAVQSHSSVIFAQQSFGRVLVELQLGAGQFPHREVHRQDPDLGAVLQF
jgi:hypothetical protein